jgi:hypothetical protein
VNFDEQDGKWISHGSQRVWKPLCCALWIKRDLEELKGIDCGMQTSRDGMFVQVGWCCLDITVGQMLETS